MLDKALETNSTQYLNFNKKKRLKEIERKLKDEMILTPGEIEGLKIERLEILQELKENYRSTATKF